MTQEELAEKTHYSPTRIALFESGELSVWADELQLLACALGVSMESLLPPVEGCRRNGGGNAGRWRREGGGVMFATLGMRVFRWYVRFSIRPWGWWWMRGGQGTPWPWTWIKWGWVDVKVYRHTPVKGGTEWKHSA